MNTLFDLIEYTARSVFLTGKAGTGKTTFLKNFTQKTAKKFVVVAPTGIAAINAGGVTIHSMFGLPLETFVPTFDEVDRNQAINITHLLPHLKFRRNKLKLLRALEILIIDEVSMLRADLLDMIDFALRAARRSSKPFGGVQLLLIGDLYQLPPVVKQSSENILYSYYNSPFFFDASVLQNISLVTYELTKIYRQSDETFVQLLNAIRENNMTDAYFNLLNKRYDPSFQPQESYVYLVSHNYMADEINNKKLSEIKSKEHRFNAEISGDFKEQTYPNEPVLRLKLGAQVMFIRNDTSEEKKYFNGMLAKISELKDDGIKVIVDGKEEQMEVKREVWENKKYYLDEEKKIKEDVIGKYEQYPFKLAWAVTIHKSQGLTFDRVIIDAGNSFTAGQVYVALSRCRTLQGIVLKSHIPQHAIKTDNRIAIFQQQTNIGEKAEDIVEAEKYNYSLNKIVAAINTQWMKDEIEAWENAIEESRFLNKHLNDADDVRKEANNLITVFEKYEKLISLLSKNISAENNWNLIESKTKGGVNYFFEEVNKKIFTPLKNSYAETKGQKGLKGYNDILKNLVTEMEEYLTTLKDLSLFDKKLYTKKENDVISSKIEKKPSHLITFQLFEEGKSVEEIAQEREIVVGTVYGHLAKMASLGVVDISRLFSQEKINSFEEKFKQQNFESINEWKTFLNDEFDYSELRLLLNHFTYLKVKDK